MAAFTGTIGILGTGRMGTHLTAHWGAADHRITMGSRDKLKAEKIVDSIVLGRGYVGNQGENVPPFSKDNWKIRGGSLEEACESDVLVLVTPFPSTATMLNALRAHIVGKGKVIIDMTNPWYSGTGLPHDGPQSAVELHKALLNDDTISYAIAYKTILWRKILPQSGEAVQVPVAGDERAKAIISTVIASTGFVPIDHGDLSVCSALEPGRR